MNDRELYLDMKRQRDKYRKAFMILIEYFNDMYDEDKKEIHEKLKKLGL